jgi:hypothetical protein
MPRVTKRTRSTLYRLLEEYQRRVEEVHRLRERIKQLEHEQCECTGGKKK